MVRVVPDLPIVGIVILTKVSSEEECCVEWTCQVMMLMKSK